MNTTIKTIIGAAAAVLGLAGLAGAQDAPVLFGDYTANVERAANVDQTATASTGGSVSYGFSTEESSKTTAPMGNYAPNIRMDDIRGGK